jgi:hypothetical protein
MSVQIEWSSCSKCQGLFFGPGKGRCPADHGEHSQTHSFLYAVGFDVPPTANMQPGWAACSRCQGMHFAGFPSKGVCPAGGPHTETGSFAYALMHDLPPAPFVQSEWRACPKCRGLFFGPFKGVCPADGREHSAEGSFDYSLQFLIRRIHPALVLVDRRSEIEVTGNDFSRDSGINIDYGYHVSGSDGVTFTTRGSLAARADGLGNFSGMTFSIPVGAFNIGARAVDVLTGQDAVAPLIRSQ